MKKRPALTVSSLLVRRTRGFTLIELMITVAVIGILAAIAYPSYTEYIRRGKISEATSELSVLRVQLEQYYQNNRNYGPTGGTACGVAIPSSPSFSFSCTASGTNNQAFLVTATGTTAGGMSGYVFTLNQDNGQATTQFAGTTVTANCWMKRRGETC